MWLVKLIITFTFFFFGLLRVPNFNTWKRKEEKQNIITIGEVLQTRDRLVCGFEHCLHLTDSCDRS